MFNDSTNPIFALAVISFAFVFSSVLARHLPVSKNTTRISSLDGLRGVLVLAVFIAHSSVWNFYVKTGAWGLPPSKLFGNLGQASVALFFMITGFLFFSKIIRANGKAIDWTQIYISRILRLTPLYLLMILIVCAIVAFESGFAFFESRTLVMRQLANWLTFGISGMPDINQLKGTAKIIAFVIWTLPYEWIFYLSLPTLALLAGAKPTKTAIVLSSLVLALVVWRMGFPRLMHLSIFLGGIAAAYCDRSPRIREYCAGKAASAVALACVGWALFGFTTTFATAPILLLSVAFIIVACGNSVFGLLISPGVRLVGDAGYSVYLLHGSILYVAFNSFIGSGSEVLENPTLFWGIIATLTMPLIGLCFITFRFVETPAMNSVVKVKLMFLSAIGQMLRVVHARNPATRA